MGYGPIINGKQYPITPYLGSWAQQEEVRRSQFKYKCQSIKSGRIYDCGFTAAQHSVFSDPAAYPPRTIRRVIDELIRSWNRQQPKDWRYWVEPSVMLDT